jgi:hypothetical protein
LGFEQAVPVMAVNKANAPITQGVGLDEQLEEADYEVVRLNGQLGNMKRALAEKTTWCRVPFWVEIQIRRCIGMRRRPCR